MSEATRTLTPARANRLLASAGHPVGEDTYTLTIALTTLHALLAKAFERGRDIDLMHIGYKPPPSPPRK